MDIKEQKLIVSQKVEGIEALTGFETKNKYAVQTQDGKQLFYAWEESDGMMRFLLKSMRALKLNIIDNNKVPQMSIDKSFAFWLPEYKVIGPDSKILGTIKVQFAVASKKMDILDANGAVLFTIKASLPHIWTLKIFRGRVEVGQILKKWSGAGKEMFTDADNFLVDFGQIADRRKRELVLAAAFAVDLSYFERSK